MQIVEPSDRIEHKNHKHYYAQYTVPYIEGSRRVLKLNELKGTGPHNSKICKSHRLINVGESVSLIVTVVLYEVVI